MPAILDRETEGLWLEGPTDTSPGAVADFLAAIKCEQELEAYPVSSLVNSPANDLPEVLKRV
jgi:putative SOS response-associated peptidase YedK